MRLVALILLSLALPALAEPLTHEEYEDRIAKSKARAEDLQRRDVMAMERDVSKRGKKMSFVFLKRDGDGPYQSLSATHFGLGDSSCAMSSNDGTIDAGSHFQMRALGKGEFEIVPKHPKSQIKLPSFNFRRSATPEKKPRWKIKRNFNGTFDVCSAETGGGLAGCKTWTIAMRLRAFMAATSLTWSSPILTVRR